MIKLFSTFLIVLHISPSSSNFIEEPLSNDFSTKWYNKLEKSKCSNYTTMHECAIHNCHWLHGTSKCVTDIDEYESSVFNKNIKNKRIHLSLPQTIPTLNQKEKVNNISNMKSESQDLNDFEYSFPNCKIIQNKDQGTEMVNNTVKKCKWVFKPYSPDRIIDINISKIIKKDYYLSFQVKYFRGNRKNYVISSNNNDSSRSPKMSWNSYENDIFHFSLGSNIQEIVFEIVSFEDWEHEMFNAEIIFGNKKTNWFILNYDTISLMILGVGFIFILLFLIGVTMIFIKKIILHQRIRIVSRSNEIYLTAKRGETKLFIEKNLKIKKMNEIDHLEHYGNTCSICLEDFRLDSQVIQVGCGHIFHKDCIIDWMNAKFINPYCPNCLYVIHKNASNRISRRTNQGSVIRQSWESNYSTGYSDFLIEEEDYEEEEEI